MKSLLCTLGMTLALVSGAMAQEGKPTIPVPNDSTGKVTSTTRYADAMKNLPAGVADKIAAARDAAKSAKADVDAMKSQGKTPEEVQAMITEKRAAASLNLQKALDALSGLPDGAKDRVSKAKDAVTKRLAERKTDTQP